MANMQCTEPGMGHDIGLLCHLVTFSFQPHGYDLLELCERWFIAGHDGYLFGA